jgi:dTDP-4-dehydrorhamnose reductase
MLGTDLMKLLAGVRPALEFRGADLPEIDITDPASIDRAIDEARPDLVINCAAYTLVDEAETHREQAMRVNARGAGLLAAAAAKRGARFVHLSTDFVFDGAKPTPYVETDAPGPLSVYGESKLEGERLVAKAAGDSLIVRTAWLYGKNGRNFVTTIRELAHSRAELAVVNDQFGSPTWTRDLAEAILALCNTDARGIVHAAGAGSCSWCEFATEIVRQSGLATRVRPITSAALGRAAKRPANSVLDTARLKQFTGFEFPRWQDSLAGFLRELGPPS